MIRARALGLSLLGASTGKAALRRLCTTSEKTATTTTAKWEAVIGIEVHTQLKVRSKLLSCVPSPFEGDSEVEPPNSRIGFCDGGLPGALPTINKEAVEKAALTGASLGGKINLFCRFDRKHYFYPDLPNGYQITQQFQPLITGGSIELLSDELMLSDDEMRPTFLSELTQMRKATVS